MKLQLQLQVPLREWYGIGTLLEVRVCSGLLFGYSVAFGKGVEGFVW